MKDTLPWDVVCARAKFRAWKKGRSMVHIMSHPFLLEMYCLLRDPCDFPD